MARDFTDTLLTDNTNTIHYISAEGLDTYSQYFGQLDGPKNVKFGEQEAVAVSWLGNRHREFIGELMDQKKADNSVTEKITPLTTGRDLVATSLLLTAQEYDPWAPLPDTDRKEIELLFGVTLHEDEDNTAFGSLFLARRRPGTTEPEVTWSPPFELASINRSTAENEQSITNLARFIEFIKTITDKSATQYGLTETHIGPHDFIKQAGRYIANGDAGMYIMPEEAVTYPFELAVFPETLSESAVLKQKIRLERYLLTGEE